MTESGRFTTARFFWRASMSARSVSMADRQRGMDRKNDSSQVVAALDRTHGSVSTSFFVRLESALTLRLLAHSRLTDEPCRLHTSPSKCYLCARSILLPMFPVAQRS